MASINDEKLRIMEDEMNRFEEEIGLPNAPLGSEPCQVIGTGTYDQVQRQLDMDGPLPPPHIIPPPPPPPPMFIPQQVRMGPPGPPMPGMGPPMPDQRPGHPGMNFVPGPGPGPMGPYGGPMGPGPMGFRHPGPPHMGPPGMMPPGPMCPPGPPRHPGHMPPPHGFPMGPMSAAPPIMAPPMISPAEYKSPSVIKSKPVPAKVVVSATPKLYISKKPTTDSNGSAPVIGVSEMPRIEPSSDDAMKKAAKKHTPQKPGGVVAKEMAEKVKASAIVSISTDASAATANASNTQTSKKKDKKSKKFIRTAGGNSWEDSSLCEWEEDDFRLFCGDLGNDVTDEVLNRAFSKYPSFLKAKVVRDKRTNKTKGFGFVSFKDPQDFIRATKEMNGRYVGSRPIKLRKSTWKQRSLEVVRKKDKEKQALIGLLTGR